MTVLKALDYNDIKLLKHFRRRKNSKKFIFSFLSLSEEPDELGFPRIGNIASLEMVLAIKGCLFVR